MAAVAPPEHPCHRFVDAVIEGVTMRPIDPDPPKMKGIRLQTEKLSLVNRRLQSLEMKDMDAQTMMPGEGEAIQEDPAALTDFLRRVMPVMEEELNLAWHSIPVFDAYEPLWDDMTEDCEMTHQVYKEGQVDLQVTSIAWNCTGAMLACSFGNLDTTGWCDVTAPVCVWNMFRPQMVAGEPDTTISIQGFAMCLAFHPAQPAILAGGSYNGELMIWNTASDDLDPLVATSSIDDYFHREAIQTVEWIPADLSGGADAYLVATVSGDGKVLIWDAREYDLSHPSRGFMLFGSKRRILGGRCLSFSPLDPWLFVIGCETGTVMRAFRPPPGASMGKPQGNYSWKPAAVALLDQLAANSRLQLQHHVEQHCRTVGINEVTAEVVFNSKPDPAVIFPAPKTTDLEPHAGPVTAVNFSPFHRKLLLTGSVDGSVRLYDVLQQRAIQALFPPTKHLSTCAISAVSWSSARPCVFAVAMEMGGVFIYDLLQSRQEPVLTLPLTGSQSQKVTSLVFNPRQRGLLAVGDDNGRVRTFRLPFRLSEQKKEEMSFIARLMASAGSTLQK
jgi:WD40 repeat protein